MYMYSSKLALQVKSYIVEINQDEAQFIFNNQLAKMIFRLQF